MRIIYFALSFLAVSALPSGAEAQKWEATSTTALAITGNIAISGSRITFGNGRSIMLRPVAENRPGVYTIDPPSNPTLLNGNKLCGDDPPTFILIAQNGNSLYLHVFDGPTVPQPSTGLTIQKGMCANYNYER